MSTSAITSPVDEEGWQLYMAKLRSSIDLRRSLVRRFPQSPTAHSNLGSWLGMLGKNFGDKGLIDEGIVECKIRRWSATRLGRAGGGAGNHPGEYRRGCGPRCGKWNGLRAPCRNRLPICGSSRVTSS